MAAMAGRGLREEEESELVVGHVCQRERKRGERVHWSVSARADLLVKTFREREWGGLAVGLAGWAVSFAYFFCSESFLFFCLNFLIEFQNRK